tara:strand:- start:825 stop:1031 length:207 start_codon:yes stop_codon:yes gene_type:complete
MAYRKLPTIFKVVAFRDAMKHGDIKQIAKKTGYSVDMASKTLRGLRNNETIVNVAYRMVKDRNPLTFS